MTPMTTIDQIIINWFNTGFNGAAPTWVGNLLLIALSILLAILFSGIIGLEREYYGHAAGLRTHILVATGSAIVMMISIYGFAAWDAAHPDAVRDPARLAAQIVTGIGFLGAGTILQTGTGIKGLTTATTIWIVMALGIACGSGNFVIGALGTALAFGALVMMRKIEEILAKRTPIIVMLFPSDKAVLAEIITIANRNKLTILNTDSLLLDGENGQNVQITIHCKYTPRTSISSFVEEVRVSLKPLEIKSLTNVQK